MKRIERRSAWRALVGACVALLALLPQVVSAHVGVLPAAVPAATLQVFTVRVPTERDIPTTSVRIEFPAEMIISRFEPMPGWTRTVDKDGAGRITAATWANGSIAADEYQDFVFMARTPREAMTLTFPAYQTYQDGEVVVWNEAPDAEHPAPTVEVVISDAPAAAPTEMHMESTTAEAGATTDAATSVSAATQIVPATPTVLVAPTATFAPLSDATVAPPLVAGGASASNGGSDLPLFVSLVALAMAAIGVVLAVVALLRRPVAP